MNAVGEWQNAQYARIGWLVGRGLTALSAQITSITHILTNKLIESQDELM